MFKLIKTEDKARRGVFTTVHGTVETPVFMNVATSAAIKGGVTTDELRDIGCQVALANTYHLHIRPGDEVVAKLGGVRKFMGWDGPLLTDSGGFQVFSLAGLRKISERGVEFSSHVDGRRIFMGPEESIQIQSNLGSTIAMAFDECVENPAEYDYAARSSEMVIRWAKRSKDEMERRNSSGSALNPDQLLFGINQGATFDDLRVENIEALTQIGFDGYAIGGLAVGEPTEEMYRIIELVEPHMPADRPRYLMGVGTPVNLIEAVYRGVDFFDCVMPSRNARHGHLFTWQGTANILNARYQLDDGPIDPGCDCPVCRKYSKAYLRHLFKAGEILAMRLAVTHNLYFYNSLMAKIREAIDEGRFGDFRREWAVKLGERI